MLTRARRGSIAIAIERTQSSALVREDQVNRSPILESFILLGFLLVLDALGLKPTIFRVSRVFLDSRNSLVNTEKDTSCLFFSPLFYFMKMISIKLMCN